MKKWNWFSLLVVVVLINLARPATAGAIISVTQPTGPGGTGATAIDTQYSNDGINSLLDVDLTFFAFAPISFSFVVTFTPFSIPEPSSLALLGSGLPCGGLGNFRTRRRLGVVR